MLPPERLRNGEGGCSKRLSKIGMAHLSIAHRLRQNIDLIPSPLAGEVRVGGKRGAQQESRVAPCRMLTAEAQSFEVVSAQVRSQPELDFGRSDGSPPKATSGDLRDYPPTLVSPEGGPRGEGIKNIQAPTGALLSR